MDFMKLFGKEKREKNLSEECAIEDRKDEGITLPRIVLDELDLQEAVGRWLGLQSEQELCSTRLVSTEFAQVLKMIGVDSHEKCVLNHYDSKNNSFHMSFQKKMKDMEVTLKHSTFNSEKQLVIQEEQTEKTYGYVYGTNDIEYYQLKGLIRGNTLWKGVVAGHSCVCSLVVNSGKYKLVLQFPGMMNQNMFPEENGDVTDHLVHDEKLEAYLLGLTFPVAVEDVYKKICKLSSEKINNSHRFMMEIEKNGSSTDFIHVNKGEMVEFITTRKGKKISVDRLGNWTYESEEVSSIREGNQVDMTFHITAVNPDQIAKTISPQTEFERIEQEVGEVRTLTKTIFKSNKGTDLLDFS